MFACIPSSDLYAAFIVSGGSIGLPRGAAETGGIMKSTANAFDDWALLYHTKQALFSQVCIDTSDAWSCDLPSILRAFSRERLAICLHTVQEHGRADSASIGVRGGKKPPAKEALVAELVRRASDADYIAYILPLFAPPIVTLFFRACQKPNGVKLDDACLDNVLSALHSPDQIIQMNLLQMFCLGFIAGNKKEDDLPDDETAEDYPSLRFIVPTETANAVKTFGKRQKDALTAASKSAYSYDAIARAAANLYGALTFEELARTVDLIFQKDAEDSRRRGDVMNADALLNRLQIHGISQSSYFIDSSEGVYYLLHTGLIVQDEDEPSHSGKQSGRASAEREAHLTRAVDVDSLKNLRARQQGKSRYIPTVEEFFAYADDDYYEQTPQVCALRALLKPVCKGYTENYVRSTPAQQREAVLLELHWDIVLGYSCQDYLDVFEDYHIKYDRLMACVLASKGRKADDPLSDADETEGLNILVSAIMDMSNHTRMWDNCGHTPDEIMKQAYRSGQDMSMKTITFGPNMRKTLAGDKMSMDKMRQAVWDMRGISASTKADMLEQLNAIEKSKREALAQGGKEPGRNDPCPCGSGKKYKHCCGKNKA